MVPAWITTQPIAHRGWHNGGSIPENSLAACEAAIAQNYAIELDLQLLADGTIVVFHDEDGARMTGQSGAIARLTASQLATLTLQGNQTPIPHLTAVLALVQGQVPLLLEVKTQLLDATAPAIWGPRLQACLQSYAGAYAVQSFNPYMLAWCKKYWPTVPRGQLAGRFQSAALPWHTRWMLRHLLFNGVSHPQFIGYEVQALPAIAPAIARHGLHLPLLAWTVRTPADLKIARRYADNIIFEGNPDQSLAH